ncbi:MAG: hypothetical protein HIU86_13650 [Acidobacteria bacterium]|nr:hypothetical protein [Acidobacteriota bacterium]
MRSDRDAAVLPAAHRAERALLDLRRVLRMQAPTMPECWALLGALEGAVGQLPPLLEEIALNADLHARRTDASGDARAALRRAIDCCRLLSVELESACTHFADRA